MRMFVFAAAVVGLFAPLLSSSPAQAQATRTWVSGVGDDANPCSRTAPCKTFAGAISKTATGGEINCIDPGGFGSLTINKSITLDCGGTFGSVLVSGTNGIVVVAAATDVVRIRNLSIQGLGTGLAGILGTTMAELQVENVTITGFKSGNAAGIRFQPTNAGAKLFVRDSVIDHNGIGTTTGGGIVLVPGSTGSANAQITNTRLVNNAVGLNMVSTGAISGAIQGGMIATNAGNGVTAVQSPALLIVTFDGTSIVNNGATGIANSGGTVRVSNATISRNTTGVSGIVLSFRNNNLAGNNSDGALTLIAGAPF